MSQTLTFPGTMRVVAPASGIMLLADDGTETCALDSGTLLPSATVWQEWQPQLLFGGGDAGMQLGSGPLPGYILTSGMCFWWCSIRLTYKGTSTGQLSITGLPATPVGGVPWNAAISEITGIGSGSGPVSAIVLDGTILLLGGQDPGTTPSPYVTDTDVENAALISMSGWFALETT